MREPSLSEHVRKLRKQLIDVRENSGFNREKNPSKELVGGNRCNFSQSLWIHACSTAWYWTSCFGPAIFPLVSCATSCSWPINEIIVLTICLENLETSATYTLVSYKHLQACDWLICNTQCMISNGNVKCQLCSVHVSSTWCIIKQC